MFGILLAGVSLRARRAGAFSLQCKKYQKKIDAVQKMSIILLRRNKQL
jgi:hypothetical protein